MKNRQILSKYIVEVIENSYKTVTILALFVVVIIGSAKIISADSFVMPPNNGNLALTVQLVAHVQEDPAQITLEWPYESVASSYKVYRKSAGDLTWGNPIATLSPPVTTYTDTNVVVGTAYEYTVYKWSGSSIFGNGYIYSGIKVPLKDYRGKIILIVEQNASTALSTELTTLTNDLIGDGWQVLRHNVASTSAVTTVKSLILSDYQSDPTNVKQVFLFGRVPVPYSGSYAWDGHTDHQGAWPADMYYGDMTGLWPDVRVNTTVASDPRNRNIPGDGKFDNDKPTGLVTLGVGRVDMYNMPAFAPLTEIDLLRRYLNKDHAFRVGDIVPNNKALITDNFGYMGGEAVADSGWRDFSVLVGGNNIVATSTGYFNELTSRSYLWTYGCGGGSYTSVSGIGNTNDFVTKSPQGVFNEMFGSYFGDWDSTNNVLRAPLASAGWGLTNVWAGRPHWHFHLMGLGETVGYSTLITQNIVVDSSYYLYGTASYGLGDRSNALMGDPSLRQNVMAQPSSLSMSSSDANVSLSWSASPDAGTLGYYLYIATSTDALFSRATTTLITGTSVSDRRPSGNYVYMLRAVKLETTASGSYYNASGGIFATTTVTAANTAPTISSISNFEGPINATSSTAFSIGDFETTANGLSLNASSASTSLISASGLSFQRSSNSILLNIRPIDHIIGSTTISVTVSDGQYVATSTFVMTITPIDDTTAPSVPTGLTTTTVTGSSTSLSWNQSTDSGTASGDPSGVAGYAIYKDGIFIATTTGSSFTVNDLSYATNYSFRVSAFDGASNHTVLGSALIVRTEDAPNTAPGISIASDESGPVNATTSISFSISDLETATTSLVTTASAADTSLIPASGISIYGTGADRVLRLRPADHQTGSTTILLTVSDGELFANSIFVFRVDTVADVTAPSVPSGLSVTDISINSSIAAINSVSLSWSPSTDSGTDTGEPSGVAGYAIYRDGVQVATSTETSITLSSFPVAASFEFAVAAFDVRGNISTLSSSVDVSAGGVVSVPTPLCTGCGCGGCSSGGGGGGSSYIAPISSPVFTSSLSVGRPLTVSSSSAPVLIVNPVTLQLSIGNLHKGSRGTEVVSLQRLLILRGYLVSGYDTGYFGDLTQSAVNRYENDSAEVVAPVRVLNSIVAPSPSMVIQSGLRSGVTDSSVASLQRFLNQHGFIIQISGPGSIGQETNFYGSATKRAVASFQEYYAHDILSPQGLTKGNGIVGPATAAKIQSMLTSQ